MAEVSLPALTRSRIALSADRYLEEKKATINGYLERLLTERYPTTDARTRTLSESISYSLMNGGKRIRPILTLVICERYGRKDDEALAIACATELIHTASLMLDDLPSMDNATQRRGKPANHIVYGESTTILAAVALWSEAIRLLSMISGLEMREIVRDTAESIGGHGLARGQFLDLDSAHPPRTVQDLEEYYYLKTGVLFKHAMKIGALLGQAPQVEQALFEKVGGDIGLIFQIRDDILDAVSTQEMLGKDAGSDERNGRTTYASLLGVAGAKRALEEKIEAVCTDLGRLPFASDVLTSVVRGLRVG